MADFIHAREYLESGDVVVVQCSHQCNVMVMNDASFQHYCHGRSFHHYGRYFTHFPARVVIPRDGHWNTVIDLDGGRANIRYNIEYIKG
ncbi:threonine dehydrogenase-like Zn-dependent dehydrogenase [Mesorhizobium soli]|uniref:DUF1883 domain-containing protein n=1 Tax=Pseudaminobacter soli (ex Li et al. 2025) TaxID=1295366 RepID=UPI002475CAB8|nr:DUF1883 domain-containing protein [Mesorhizobium soli]MDH6235142.1 threonine dehydrogenase-like Zn-dependent dehydrogenase [Mesorhizobium soli]